MENTELDKALSPDSPCIGMCTVTLGDPVCAGCGRTDVEVLTWISMSPAEKRSVWRRLDPRSTAVPDQKEG